MSKDPSRSKDAAAFTKTPLFAPDVTPEDRRLLAHYRYAPVGLRTLALAPPARFAVRVHPHSILSPDSSAQLGAAVAISEPVSSRVP
jgi:hypothetical protein